jgi:hypothetical protein
MTQKELDKMLEDEDEEVPGTPEQGLLDMEALEELFNESDFDANDSQVIGTQGASVARSGDKVCCLVMTSMICFNFRILDFQAPLRR